MLHETAYQMALVRLLRTRIVLINIGLDLGLIILDISKTDKIFQKDWSIHCLIET